MQESTTQMECVIKNSIIHGSAEALLKRRTLLNAFLRRSLITVP